MRVFVSSVRRGLEEERDALPGLITAIGHEPVRFEDFTATPNPSREACLAGVKSSDVYVLLVGPYYGFRFSDTNQSPTHDEWVTASAQGMPRLVFVKQGVERDEDQKQFLESIGNYGSGVFFDTFTSAVDLQAKVAQALRNNSASPPELSYAALQQPPTVRWRRSDSTNGRNVVEYPQLEVHVQAVPPRPRSNREFQQLSDSMAGRVRSAGVVRDDQSLSVSQAPSEISIAIPGNGMQRWDQPRRASLVGLRVLQDGQVSVFSQLPGDSLGSVVDPEGLPQQLAQALRLIGQLRIISEEMITIAVGIDPASSVTIGSATRLPRSHATMGLGNKGSIRIEPDEAVSGAAISTGADEVGRHLARSLVSAIG